MKKVLILILLLAINGCTENNEAEHTTLVYKSRDAVQCETPGESVIKSAQRLINSKIDVVESSCGVLTDIAYPSVCGAGTPNINIHKLRMSDLGSAQDLGYKELPLLTSKENAYQSVECFTDDYTLLTGKH